MLDLIQKGGKIMYMPTSILENGFVLLVKIIFFALCTALVFGLSFLAVWGA